MRSKNIKLFTIFNFRVWNTSEVSKLWIGNKQEKIFDGNFFAISVEYKCKNGYYIDEESKSTVNCELNGKWDLKKTPMCLKSM